MCCNLAGFVPTGDLDETSVESATHMLVYMSTGLNLP